MQQTIIILLQIIVYTYAFGGVHASIFGRVVVYGMY